MTINSRIANHLAKFEITLEEDGSTVIAYHNGKEIARGTDQKAVGKAALAALGLDARGKKAKAKSKAKAKTGKAKSKRSKKGDDEEDGSESNIIPSKYRAKYAENGGHNGDELAEFLAKTFKNEDGIFDTKGFIAMVKENGIDVGDFAVIAKNHAPGELPRGLVGRARMTLRNRLAKVVRETGHVVYDGKKRKIDIAA